MIAGVQRLAVLIQTRWGLQRPEQWRAKHLHWVLERGLTDLSPASRYLINAEVACTTCERLQHDRPVQLSNSATLLGSLMRRLWS
ncbi:hypothetical protein CCR82_13025 [Halochromatium salexigens]|uniref:Uncharacterized protein n=1 Tax=Halochromatium salexigens TaxID=49447 RepID=A0AAJ0UH71_HALSE|nr:hypothetical protein [Halochromatium salexigens]